MIDWTRARALRDEIGADGFAEVVALFLEEADEVVARLADAPPAALEGDLHFLRGSALNLGLAAVARLCDEGEHAAAAGAGARVDRVLIARVYAESRAAFVDGIAELGSPGAD